MSVRLRTWLVVAMGCFVPVGAAGVAVAGAADSRSPLAAKAGPPVGTLALVSGRILDLHLGARRPVVVRNRAKVLLGDVLTPARGASARVLFAAGVKRRNGTLFTLRAPHAATQQILVGAAFLGPRIAFGYDGRSISSVAGRGLDAVSKVAIARAGARRVRLRLTAPGALKPTFACAVDHSRFAACRSGQVLRLGVGRHTITVWTTSLFGFHGSGTAKRFSVAR